MITPPVGINLFAVMSAVADQATFKHVYLGVARFIVFDLIVLAALIAFPGIATWLPRPAQRHLGADDGRGRDRA